MNGEGSSLMATSGKCEDGMVAFLDILGYANFLQKNEPEEAVEIVLKHLMVAPKRVEEFYKMLFKEDEATGIKAKNLLDGMKWLIFSDTILLLSADDPKDSVKIKGIKWGIFLVSIVVLYRHMFDNGLPVRGSICHGKFVVKEGCFAERSIIDAYQLANRLELAAVALNQSAKKQLETMEPKQISQLFDKFLFEYPAPCKNQSTEKLYFLPPSLDELSPRIDIANIRQVVAESFWSHKKDHSPEVLRKLDNTELFFRYAKMKDPDMFSGKTE